MKSINRYRDILTILILTLFIFLPNNLTHALSTYKVNEEITFGRSYEFDEEVNGSILISGAVEKIINVGNVENDTYINNIPVEISFTPDQIGIYKLNIEVNVVSKGGKDLSEMDTIYFLVTEDGKEMSDGDIKAYLDGNDSNIGEDLVSQYINKPYIKSLEVTNATLLEDLDKERTEYNLKIDDNAQTIEFKAIGDTPDTKIEGSLSVNPNEQNINLLSVSNSDTDILYTFRWESPRVKVFKYTNEQNEEENLVYTDYLRESFLNLATEEVEIEGEKFKVYKDEAGNLLLPLKKEKGKNLPELYTFTTDGEILKKFENFFSINSQTYRQESFKKIFNEDLVLFNLEETEIPYLNYAKGYKINRTGYENQYLVNLTRPDGFSSWYQYDDTPGVKNLIILDMPDFLSEKELSNFFGIDLNIDYDSVQYNAVDITLFLIGILAVITIIVTRIIIIFKNRRED